MDCHFNNASLSTLFGVSYMLSLCLSLSMYGPRAEDCHLYLAAKAIWHRSHNLVKLCVYLGLRYQIYMKH